MKKLLFLFIGILVISDALAQTDTNPAPQPVFDGFHKNIFVEGLGAGFMGSVNFDMRLQRGRMDGIGFRVGVGGVTFSGTDSSGEQIKSGFFVMPIECNYLIGKKHNSFLMGIGILPAYISIKSGGTIDPTFEKLNTNANGIGVGGAYLSLGYRFQPLHNGFMFQINWNPVFSSNGFSPAWAGIGIGYGFK